MYHYIFSLFSQSDSLSNQENLLTKMVEFSQKYFDGKIYYQFPRIFFYDTLLDPKAFKSWFKAVISEIILQPNAEFGYRLFESHKIKEIEPPSFDPILEYATTQLIQIFWLDLYGYHPKSIEELIQYDSERNIGLNKVLASIGLSNLSTHELNQLLHLRHVNDKYLFKNMCYSLNHARKKAESNTL